MTADASKLVDLESELRQLAGMCDVYSPDQCATLIDGIGWIAMRHKLKEAADALEAARVDVERYRWIRLMAKEQLLNPKMAGSETPDMRTYWRMPTLICSGPIGGFVTLDEAIDAAMADAARGEGVEDA